MGVPRKTKSLEKKKENGNLSSKRKTGKKSDSNNRFTSYEETKPGHDKRLANAFDILQNMEEKEEEAEKHSQPENSTAEPTSSQTGGRSGFQWKIQLSACIPSSGDRDAQHALTGEKKDEVEEKELFRMRIHLPFFWNLPVVGKLSRNLIKKIKPFSFE